MSGIEYRVGSGDTLSGIARRYRTTVDELMRINGIAYRDRIWAGQFLRIPRGGSSSVRTPSPSHPASTPPASRGKHFKAVALDEFLSLKKGTQSLAAIIIGNAEGTRTPDRRQDEGLRGT